MKKTDKIHSEVKVNSVVWITSLHEHQKGVTRRIIEDLEPYLARREIRFEFREVTSAQDLLDYFDQIRSAAADGMLPIIHIDMHGGEEQGLHIAATGENVAWATVVDKFREINIVTNNNLCVVSLACFSFKAVLEIEITSQTPFYILAAPQMKVQAGFVEDVAVSFYQHVFDEQELIGAYRSVLMRKLNLMHCEEMFVASFIKYIRKACMGKGAKRRVEDLLTDARAQGIPIRDCDLSRFRKIIKRAIKPTQEQVDRYAGTFLIGRRVGFKVGDLIARAKKIDLPAKAS
jgi:hypothetical protein